MPKPVNLCLSSSSIWRDLSELFNCSVMGGKLTTGWKEESDNMLSRCM